MTVPRLILGSGSPQRQRLLADAGHAFTVVVPSEAAERGLCSNCGPAELVVELALRKAADVAAQLAHRGDHEPALIVACDTVAECRGAILGKPNEEEHARAMLRQLSGQVHRVYSGLCLWPYKYKWSAHSAETRLATTELKMDELSDAEIDEYLASGQWRGKAGAFGYQDRVGWLHITSGSESNVIGLPLELLEEMLREGEAGLPAPKTPPAEPVR